jgi:hypothetical protein
MPDRMEKAVQALTQGLQTALGAKLVSLVLYGSVARGTHVPGRSDVNVLLIVTDASEDTLRVAAPVLRTWTKAGYPPPLIHTPAEWAAGADVYPLEVEDIREAHRVLAGADPVEGLTTRREDQARELEHQARGLLLHLRGHYAAAADDGRALGALLTSTIGIVLVFCRGALRLADRSLPADPGAVIAAAASLAGFDPAPFAWALDARREGRTGLGAHDPLGAAYLAGVERLVAFVNAR